MGIRRGQTSGRRTPIPVQRLGKNKYWGAGPYRADQVNGIPRPIRYMIPQRGGLVSMRWEDGTRDWVEPGDEKFRAPVQLEKPGPLYRVLTTSYRGALMLDEDERDEAVEIGYYWKVIGYAYNGGDEETGLTKLYRSLNSGNGNHLHTVDADEHASAVSGGFTAETDSIYVFTSAAINRVAVYRFYNSGSATHFYTTELGEVSALTGTWALEGLKFYLLNGQERTVT